LMVVLYEASFLKTTKSLDWKKIVPFLLLLLVIPITWLLSGSEKILAPRSATSNSPLQYLLTEFRAMWTYIRLAFLPFHQNLDYDYPLSKSIFEASTLFSFLSLTLVLAAARWMFSTCRLVSFGIFWFFLTLLPESSLFPLADVVFEHRLYLPMAGFSIFLVSSVYYFWGEKNIKMMVMALTIIVACNSILTYQRNKIWKDDITLWSDVVQKSPHKTRGFNNLGVEHIHRGEIIQAISDFNHAIDVDPGYASAYNNRAGIYDKWGNFTQSLADYNTAIKIAPRYAEAYYNRGTTYAERGLFTQAMSDYNKAIDIDPHYAHAYNNRGFIYNRWGNLKQAVSDFNKAIEINPYYTDAYKNRDNTLKEGAAYSRSLKNKSLF